MIRICLYISVKTHTYVLFLEYMCMNCICIHGHGLMTVYMHVCVYLYICTYIHIMCECLSTLYSRIYIYRYIHISVGVNLGVGVASCSCSPGHIFQEQLGALAIAQHKDTNRLCPHDMLDIQYTWFQTQITHPCNRRLHGHSGERTPYQEETYNMFQLEH